MILLNSSLDKLKLYNINEMQVNKLSNLKIYDLIL
jgi:hypothetical protein